MSVKGGSTRPFILIGADCHVGALHDHNFLLDAVHEGPDVVQNGRKTVADQTVVGSMDAPGGGVERSGPVPEIIEALAHVGFQDLAAVVDGCRRKAAGDPNTPPNGWSHLITVVG